MAIIRRTIQNLKPGKEYILSARSVNNDLSITSAPADFIRFTVPGDQTVPGVPIGLSLNASFLSVMFVFQSVSDLDINYYEYELYLESQITGTSPNYEVIDGQSPYRSGENPANVFVVEVAENSTTSSTGSVDNPVRYFGRVRSVDTTGNKSDWSTIVVSGDTPLVDEEFIGSLTAGKITAGTIGAHTITLDGANSIIKSSNYSEVGGVPVSGWQIVGSGDASFGNVIVSGSIDAQQFQLYDTTLDSVSAKFYNSSIVLSSIPLINTRSIDLTAPSATQNFRSSSYLDFDHAHDENDPSSLRWTRGVDFLYNLQYQTVQLVGPSDSSKSLNSKTTPPAVELFRDETYSHAYIFSGADDVSVAGYTVFDNASGAVFKGGYGSVEPYCYMISRKASKIGLVEIDPDYVTISCEDGGSADYVFWTVNKRFSATYGPFRPRQVDIESKFVSFTVDTDHYGMLVEIDSASTVNVELSDFVTTADVGSQVSFVRKGTGAVNFVAASGFTILSAGGFTSLRSQYSFATAIYQGNNNWYLTGDLN